MLHNYGARPCMSRVNPAAAAKLVLPAPTAFVPRMKHCKLKYIGYFFPKNWH